MKKLPKQIYVVRTQDGSESYLTVHEDYASMDDGDIVGVYALKETRKLLVTRQLQWATASGLPPRFKT